MNIFYLDHDLKKCAEYHVDRHCTKMIIEYAQLLSSAHWMSGGEAPYKLVHKNHPCSIWTRESIDNYRWLCELGIELSKEYTYRYGKFHKSSEVIHWCLDNEPNLPNIGMTPFRLAMPDEFKCECPIESYRNYYNGGKVHLFKWKQREIPFFIEKDLAV